MTRLLAIVQTGVDAVLLHPLRSAVTAAGVIALLLPFLIGLGVSKGVQQEARLAIDLGADLYVTLSELGRPTPIPVEAADAVRKLEGVTRATPRIVGNLPIGKDQLPAVVVGLPLERFPQSLSCIEGEFPSRSGANELVMGATLARQLDLKVGSVLPPFYRNDRGERLSRVAGIFQADVSFWEGSLIVTDIDSAAALFNQQGLATDILVECRPGYQGHVRRAIGQTLRFDDVARNRSAVRVTDRADLEAALPGGLLHREGVFQLQFVPAFAVGILVVLVTSGIGLSARRREVGILKATGWQTDEVLLRALTESLLISVSAASLSVLGAFLWLEWLNGYGIAGVFLPGAEAYPAFDVPFDLTPVPALLAFLVAFVIVLSGSLYSTWRAAIAPPMEVLR